MFVRHILINSIITMTFTVLPINAIAQKIGIASSKSDNSIRLPAIVNPKPTPPVPPTGPIFRRREMETYRGNLEIYREGVESNREHIGGLDYKRELNKYKDGIKFYKENTP